MRRADGPGRVAQVLRGRPALPSGVIAPANAADQGCASLGRRSDAQRSLLPEAVLRTRLQTALRFGLPPIFRQRCAHGARGLAWLHTIRLRLEFAWEHRRAMPRLDDLRRQLDRLASQGLLRVPEGLEAVGARQDTTSLMATSNDYLGLARRNVSRETLSGSPVGAGASRLVYGTAPEHLTLERSVADWVGSEAALLFSSGYAANVGTLQSLADRDAVVISDRLNHASIIDGCRLSKARVQVVEHCNPSAVEAALAAAGDAKARWVVTESYFSMDGTSPNLTALRRLCDEHDAFLVVDEAHALGVFGPEGAGLCRQHDVRADVLIATFGKALGAQGAAVCGSAALYQWLFNRARSFVFSTAPSPLLAALVTQRIAWVRTADSERARLRRFSAELRERLNAAGVPVLAASHGPIVPIVLGSNERALEVANALSERGIAVQAIRPPTVPPGTARLRVTLSVDLDDERLQRLADALVELTR